MSLFSISLMRWGRGVWVVFSIAVWGQLAWGQAAWWLSPVGQTPGQRGLSGAALLSERGVSALGANPAQTASLRGLGLLASGAFGLGSAKFHAGASARRFSANPQVALAWRLPEGWGPEGFAVGLSWGRGALAIAPEGALAYIPLHRILANLAWELLPGFRLGAELQLAVTESSQWTLGEETQRWKGGRLSGATRAGVTVELLPKQWHMALLWEEGLSLSSREGRFAPLKTPHSVVLAGWLGSPGAWELEINALYAWRHTWADAAGLAKAHEALWGARAGLGIWLTPVIQLKAGGAVFFHNTPTRASWAQPMEAWSGSLSAGALWRYGPMRAEVSWQMLAGFASSQSPAPQLQQRLVNTLHLGVGWSFN